MKNIGPIEKLKQMHEIDHFDIKAFPGYVGKMPIGEIIDKLEGKAAYTYAISDTNSNEVYMLSFIRGDGDQGLMHVHFSKSIEGSWRYKNGLWSTDPVFPNLLRKMMHIPGVVHQPIPLY
jgi:hypothetical protein